MSRLTDDELGRQLNRRLSAAPLDDSARYELTERISQRARAHHRPAARHPAWGWVGAAVAAGLALAFLAVVALPRAQDNAGPSATLGATPSPPPSIRVLSGSELAALAHDPAHRGRVVVARARVVPADLCVGCPGTLANDTTVIVSGVLDSELEVAAFRIHRQRVEIVGVVEPGRGGVSWTIAEINSLALPNESDGNLLYPVEGWLVETAPTSCPAPEVLFDDDPTNDDLRWYCRTGWLEPEPAYTQERRRNGVYGLPLPEGSLPVQAGAYQDFAVDPQYGERGAEPRYGVYVVRPAGCPETAAADCPVWEMIARLDAVPGDIPSPSVSPSLSPSPSEPAASQDAILGAVARWLADERLRPPDRFVYVHGVVSEAMFDSDYFGPHRPEPELRSAGPPRFDGPMSVSTRSAIESSLLPVAQVEFVANPQDVVDPEGFEHYGCRPYLAGNWMVRLGPPHLSGDGDSYFVFVNIDKGCAGDTYVVEVTWIDGGYEVTRVVVTGGWIV